MTFFVVYLCLSVGLTAALVAGVFQSFSDFVMAGLTRAHPAGGIDSMQNLNRTVFRSVFLSLFLLLMPLTLGFAAYAYTALEGFARMLILSGGIVYVTTVFTVTVFGNVPMTKRLDKLDPTSAEAEAYWGIYGRVWTRWNHIRTLGSIATAACYLLAAVELLHVP